MINFSLYTSMPAGENVGFLQTEYRRKLSNSLKKCLISAQETLEIDLEKQLKKSNLIDISKKFSPLLFKIHSDLLQSIEKGDVTCVLDAIKQFSRVPPKDFYDAEFRIESILSEGWEKDFVEHMRKEQVQSKDDEPFVIRPIINDTFTIYEKALNELEKLIQAVDPLFYCEYKEYPTRLKLFHGKGLIGASAVRVYGAIYLRTPKPTEPLLSYFCEHMVHEVSHLHLYSLLAHDNLLLNPYGELYEAPIRIDKRPLYGIFHATFVLSRMVRMFRLINSHANPEGFAESLKLFRLQFNKGISTLKAHAKLTKNGCNILASMEDCAEY